MYVKSIIIEHVQIMIQMKILIDFKRNFVISDAYRQELWPEFQHIFAFAFRIPLWKTDIFRILLEQCKNSEME